MFALYHSSGFHHAPVTKGLVGGLVLTSVALNVPLQSYQSFFNFSYDSLSNHIDLLKFITSRLVFLDPKDLLCACILLYHFRIFERRYGSRKFSSRILGSFFLSLLFEFAAVYALRHVGTSLDLLPSGPYGPVYSFFIPYFTDIPRVAHSHVFGVPITGKSLNYIIGLQMASSSPESLLLAILGIVVGFLIQKNIFLINDWLVIPKIIGKLFHHTLGRLIETPAPSENFTPMGATLEIQRAEHIEHLEQQMAWAQMQQQNRNHGFNVLPLGNNRGQQQAAMANGNINQPSEEQVRQLVEMGFNRDNVLQALRATDNNVTMATNILLQES